MALFLKSLRRRALLALAVWLFLGQAALAQALIRDAEVEALVRRIADPLFAAAGLDPEAIRIFVVQDPAINAFVAGGQNL
ncbi:MAG: M48 family peptidase, partial [Geminicoccaceae bacterium]|nr:M48 family peptidase [Geminicoccaceae bacterium]